MSENDLEFRQRLFAIFQTEAQEHTQNICNGLLQLEQDQFAPKMPLVETIFRETHSLKGAARAISLPQLESLCQALENIFSAWKNDLLAPSADLFDLLQKTLDALNHLLLTTNPENPQENRASSRPLIAQLEKALDAHRKETPEPEQKSESQPDPQPPQQQEPEPSPAPPQPASLSLSSPPESPPLSTVVPTETVRVSTNKLSSLLLQSEEMLSVKLAANQRVLERRKAGAAFNDWKKEWTRTLPLIHEMRAALRRCRETQGGAAQPSDQEQSLERLMTFFDWNEHFVNTLKERHIQEKKALEQDSRILAHMVNSLLDDMKQVLMFPFSSLLELLPKVVRDLSRSTGKKVDVQLSGGEIEIDRRILDEMKDPLVHLIRNCIDHGIETPAERLRKNKSETGAIVVTVTPRDNKVELVIADDGSGLSLEALRSSLRRQGKMSAEEIDAMTDTALESSVFQSGISTSPIITEISGRGLGLAIVREKVENLGGSIKIFSRQDQGTRFLIILPLTVATFRGILLRSAGREFIVPTIYVERVLRLAPHDIGSAENRETITLNGQPVSLVRLSAILGITSQQITPEDTPHVQALVLGVADTQIAFAVDEIQSEQEVLFKSLGPQLTRVRNISGATVLGSGRVTPILNVPDLFKSAVKHAAKSRLAVSSPSTDESSVTPKVLIAEDSITTRTLLKNILQASGFNVTTAVDGQDALTKLRNSPFDILVSDVEMPRLNGFELTARVRRERELADLPVVLVTALAAQEDRERGIDVGANAYIVKSSFDQSDLLDVMARLL
nr:response regulator [uncultured Desulfuromonas sp.]